MNKNLLTKQSTGQVYRYVSGAILAFLMGFSSTGMATNESADELELAIEGYDPVAYFTMLASVQGKDTISYEWLDKKWIFVSEEHRFMFETDPMRYLPNFGGFCSVDEVNPGHHLVHDVDPQTWRIVDGKLYLFYEDEHASKNIPVIKWKEVKAGLQSVW